MQFYRRLFSILFFIWAIPLISYRTSNNIDAEKYFAFISAIDNNSTFRYFTVITAKNLNTGLTKEICTTGNFVSGALHIELGVDYSKKGEQKVLAFAKTRKDRYFEFKNKKALDNISFFDYNPSKLATIRSKYNLDAAVRAIKKNNKFTIRLSDNEMKLFAHALFNLGILAEKTVVLVALLNMLTRRIFDRKIQKALVLQRFASELSQRG